MYQSGQEQRPSNHPIVIPRVKLLTRRYHPSAKSISVTELPYRAKIESRRFACIQYGIAFYSMWEPANSKICFQEKVIIGRGKSLPLVYAPQEVASRLKHDIENLFFHPLLL
jgi:hypothetical protein